MQPVHALLRLILLPLALIAVPGTSLAQKNKPSDSPRVVLKGHDPVAYFTEGRPVKGSARFAHDWDGERYYFASAANRDRFAADPERYAPQFGGYCTGSLSRNIRNEAHPDGWIISEGKLYVFGEGKFRAIALKDPKWLETRIPLAAANWRQARK